MSWDRFVLGILDMIDDLSSRNVPTHTTQLSSLRKVVSMFGGSASTAEDRVDDKVTHQLSMIARGLGFYRLEVLDQERWEYQLHRAVAADLLHQLPELRCSYGNGARQPLEGIVRSLTGWARKVWIDTTQQDPAYVLAQVQLEVSKIACCIGRLQDALP